MYYIDIVLKHFIANISNLKIGKIKVSWFRRKLLPHFSHNLPYALNPKRILHQPLFSTYSSLQGRRKVFKSGKIGLKVYCKRVRASRCQIVTLSQLRTILINQTLRTLKVWIPETWVSSTPFVLPFLLPVQF